MPYGIWTTEYYVLVLCGFILPQGLSLKTLPEFDYFHFWFGPDFNDPTGNNPMVAAPTDYAF